MTDDRISISGMFSGVNKAFEKKTNCRDCKNCIMINGKKVVCKKHKKIDMPDFCGDFETK